jgi:hypothetical protein
MQTKNKSNKAETFTGLLLKLLFIALASTAGGYLIGATL